MSDDQTWRTPGPTEGGDGAGAGAAPEGAGVPAPAEPPRPQYGEYAAGYVPPVVGDAQGGQAYPQQDAQAWQQGGQAYPQQGAPAYPQHSQAYPQQNAEHSPPFPSTPRPKHAQQPQQSWQQAPQLDQAWQQAPQPGQPYPPQYPQAGYAHPGYPQQDWQQYPPPGQPQHDWQQQYPGAPTAQPGWAPPPKPGLVPLRPLSFGTLIGAPFQALRRNPRITVGAALLLQGIPTILVSVLAGAGVFLFLSRLSNADSADRGAIAAGAVGATIVLGVLSVVISTVFSAILQGIVVAEVARETLGEKLTFRALWRQVRGRVGALIGYAFLFALAWIVAAALVVGIVVALAALGGPAGVVGSVLVGIGGGIGLIVVAVWVNTKLAVVPSAIVIERLPLGAAIARSWRLTNANFWRSFGLIILIGIIVYAITQVIGIPFSLIGTMLGGIFAPTSVSSPDASSFSAVIATQLGSSLLSTVATAIVGAIGSVVQTAAVALLYIDLRMRKEGLDLQLVRFVEARQAGQDLPDPYTQQAPGATTAPTAPWPGV